MGGIIKDAIILCVITLVAGALLGGVHEVTLAPIAQAQTEAANKTYREVYPEAADFQEDAELTSALEAAQADSAYGGIDKATLNGVMVAKDASGNNIGYLVTASSGKGYGGQVKISVGITNDGKVTGIGFLTLNETPGLGMKAKDSAFKSAFVGLSSGQPVTFTKTAVTADNQIQAISGATHTTEAVVDALNLATYFVNNK